MVPVTCSQARGKETRVRGAIVLCGYDSVTGKLSCNNGIKNKKKL